ncbi:MAG TPA: APC family permease [Burkholderiaceae bacterium]|jgi:amino acid transporter|nr:APC family permease [Burkholderiaceae bacterium]
MTAAADQQAPDRDAEQLRLLGYVSHFDRTMSLWENFALGFTYLSPVVGVYTIFATAFAVGGPPMWWTYVWVGLGQLMVCLVFGEIVSQFPISGGLYPWARRLYGKRWAWMAGWVYGWALFVTLAGIATGAAPFLAELLGLEGTPAVTTTIAIALIVLTTGLNLSGTRLLARVAMFGLVCELIGAIVVGSYLLIFARHQPWSVLVDTHVIQSGGSYWPAFLASSLAAMFCYYGFEACGDVAEETPDAGRQIPKAMRLTIYVGGAAALWVCLGLVLSVPDIGAVLAGRDKDPVVTVLKTALGEVGFRVVIAVVMVSFVSAQLSLQAAASRLLFGYARDDMIVGSRYLARLSRGRHVPANALILAGAVPALIALSAPWLQDAVATIISFAAIGIYIAFQMVVFAALVARSRGWLPAGVFRLGVWAWPVNLVAFVYGVGAIINMAWPRSPQDPWYSNYAMILTSASVLGLGALFMVIARPYDRGHAPAGDAHRLQPSVGEPIGD